MLVTHGRIGVSTVIAVALLIVAAPAASAAPLNDERSHAIAIASLPYTDTVDVVDATCEADTPDGGCLITNDVWYVFMAAAGSLIEVNTFGSEFDTYLCVEAETPQGDLQGVGCNNDFFAGGTGPESQVTSRRTQEPPTSSGRARLARAAQGQARP